MANEKSNVMRQFIDRYKTQLQGTAPLAMDGRPIETEGRDYWYEAKLLPVLPEPANGPDTRIEDWSFQVDVFCVVDHKRVGAFKAIELTDTAINAFKRTTVDVLDWTETTPTTVLAKLQFLYPSVDPVPTDDPRLMRLSITIPAKVFDA